MGALAAVQLLAGSMDQHKTGALERNAGNRRDEGSLALQAQQNWIIPISGDDQVEKPSSLNDEGRALFQLGH